MFDFGGSGSRFGRLRASILEAPGLDFGASSLDFEASRLDCGASRPPTFLCLCFPHSATPLGKRGTVSCLGFIPFVFWPSSTALPSFRSLWTSYLEPRTPRTPKKLQKQKLHHKVARPPKGGWAAVIPPGGFNYNPPHPGFEKFWEDLGKVLEAFSQAFLCQDPRAVSRSPAERLN